MARVCRRLGVCRAGLGFALLLLAGCSREEAGEYDGLAAQVLSEYFAAAAAGQHEQALQQLKRLEDLAPGEPFVLAARRHELLRDALLRVNQALAAGKLDEARAVLAGTAAVLGTAPELRQAEAALACLTAVETYGAQQPFRDLATASRALATVQSHRGALQDVPPFQDWIKTQEGKVAEMRRAEMTRQATQFVQDMDLLVLNDAGDAEAVLRRLDEMPTDTPGLSVLMAVFRNRAPGWTGAALRAENWREPVPRLGLEVGLFLHRTRWTAELRRLALEQLKLQAPRSLSGLAAGIRLAAAAGEYRLAGEWAARLTSETELSVSLMVEGLRHTTPGPIQFQAKAWRTPFPAFPDLLARFQGLVAAKEADPPKAGADPGAGLTPTP